MDGRNGFAEGWYSFVLRKTPLSWGTRFTGGGNRGGWLGGRGVLPPLDDGIQTAGHQA
jgi:hypothetical protein